VRREVGDPVDGTRSGEGVVEGDVPGGSDHDGGRGRPPGRYGTPFALSVAFKRELGTSRRDYRNRAVAGSRDGLTDVVAGGT
jgi:hypothetical protein